MEADGPRSAGKPRYAALDALRGIAALAVVLFHYTVRYPDFHPTGEAPFAFAWGLYGVHLFFMISGFVILMSLSASGGAGFVRSRFIRLFPVFWAAVLLTSAVLLIAPGIGAAPGPLQFAANLTMAEEYLHIAPIDGAYWSLTYELGFYAMMYALVRFAPRQAIGWVPLWMLAGAALFPLVMRWIPHPLHLLIGVHPYGHLFASGVAIYLLRAGCAPRYLWLVPLAAPLVQFSQDGAVGLACVALAVAAMVLATRPAMRLPDFAMPLLWLGAISYALYLAHQMIGYVLLARLQALGAPPALALALTLVFAIALGAALTIAIERPSARWLKQVLPRGTDWLRLPGMPRRRDGIEPAR